MGRYTLPHEFWDNFSDKKGDMNKPVLCGINDGHKIININEISWIDAYYDESSERRVVKEWIIAMKDGHSFSVTNRAEIDTLKGIMVIYGKAY
jgi:hypothetical protein